MKLFSAPAAILKRLAAEAAAHEQHAAALRRAIDEITGRSHRKRATAAAMFREAATLDERRRSSHPKKKSKHPPGDKASVRKRRAGTVAFLNRFDHEEPRPAPNMGRGGKGLGTLLRHGYLKRKGGGFVRTAKPFEIDT